jgi:hypothetical protein
MRLDLVLPRWVIWYVRGLLLLPSVLAAVLVLIGAYVAFGAMTSLPPASREQSLCFALGAEAPCTYREIGALRGTLTVAANTDPENVHTLVLLFTARGSAVADLQFNTAASETDVLATVADPLTNWDKLIARRDTWPALRALARVTDGVPVLVAAKARKGAVDHTGDPLASVALLKVRVAFMQLVE